MLDDQFKQRVRKVYRPETWEEARGLYQGGMSLEAVGKELGIPYPTVWYHAWMEDWGVRVKGVKRDPRAEAAKAQKLARKLAREEALMVMEASLVKADDLEVLARKSLAGDSARAKVMISRRVTEILTRLEDPSVPPRSAAQALGALAPIFRLVYRWDEAPDVGAMQRARSGAINLELLAVPPEALKAPAPARKSSRATEHNDKTDGTLSIQGEHPKGAGDGQVTPQKEAPTFPAADPGQGNPPPGVADPPLEPPPAPGSPEWHRLRLTQLDRARAAWRGHKTL
jgi:hypothetical protein